MSIRLGKRKKLSILSRLKKSVEKQDGKEQKKFNNAIKTNPQTKAIIKHVSNILISL